MSKVQEQSRQLSEIEEILENYERQLSVVRKTTDQIHSRLNDVRTSKPYLVNRKNPLTRKHLPMSQEGLLPQIRIKFEEMASCMV